MAWETGNELYYPDFLWTVDIARHIKETLGAKQLVMDGRYLSRTGVYDELANPDYLEVYRASIDIMSDHGYPLSVDNLMTAMETAANIGLPLVLGEVGWDKDTPGFFLNMIQESMKLGLLAGDLFWSMFGHAETFGHVTHDDGFSMYWPNGPEPASFHHNNPAFRTLMKNISDHMFLMSSRPVPETYLMSDIAPVITILDCKPQQWIRLANLDMRVIETKCHDSVLH